ncbi:uncharacterized protein EI97DRAFT_439959 [Westerdykella ornata]|uniref:BTB domain-containing protein n=1 Tax=Westerdykella ornata TaxID=318751 RepID=A0A6A6JSV4_WESOR|nr:uncharacterized protein EI97DRAFT_439959 [Westerdykella ornata]KAF2279642.1 hypothetical protein EI97DRAFT_439959 [Westerdykella ornata]
MPRRSKSRASAPSPQANAQPEYDGGDTSQPFNEDALSGVICTILYGLAGVYLYEGNAASLYRKSRWFREIITYNLVPNSTAITITLDDNDDRAVYDMLRFIHEQPLEELHAEGRSGLNTVISAVNLFKLADRYGIAGLEDVAAKERFPEALLLYLAPSDITVWNPRKDEVKQELLYIIKMVYAMASTVAERTEHPLWAALWEAAIRQDLDIGSKPSGTVTEVSLNAVLAEFMAGDHLARSIMPYLHIGHS